MEKTTSLTMDHSLFSGETIGEVCILTFKKAPLLHIADLEADMVVYVNLENTNPFPLFRCFRLKHQQQVKMSSSSALSETGTSCNDG